jgi:hypothetical protein
VTTSYPAPSPTSAGSVLDGDPRILIPLPEVAERLGISGDSQSLLAGPTTRRRPQPAIVPLRHEHLKCVNDQPRHSGHEQ